MKGEHVKRWVSGLVMVAVAGTAVAAPPAYHAAVGMKGPVLWYRFGEPAGSTTTNNFGSMGAAYNGQAFNGVTFGVATSAGDTGASFNSTLAQYIESLTAAPAALTGNPTFTAEAIVKVASAGGGGSFDYAPFLHWGAPATGQSVYFSLWANSPNNFYAGFYNGGLRAKCNFASNEWYHLVWVRNSASGTAGQYQGTTLYINGTPVLLEPDTHLPGAPTINVTSTTFRVQRATDHTRYFTGVMDELVLYSRALTADEVAANYASLGFRSVECRADLNEDCLVDFSDYLDFLNRFDAEDPSVDFNMDGLVDFSDYLEFLNLFDAGC